MIVVPFVLLVASSESIAIAHRLEETHTRMKKASVFVSDGLFNAIPTKVRIDSGICLLAMPNQQMAEVKPTEVRFYDEIFNQVTSLKNPKPAKIPDSAAKVAIVQREAIAWLVDESQKKAFFADIRKDPRWKVSGSTLKLTDAKRKIRSEVYFDTSFRVTEIKLTVANRMISDWKYRYVSDTDIPRIPANARVVKGLPSRPAIPTTTKGNAVLLAQGVWRSMSRLEGRKITQILDDGTYKLSFGGGKLSESGPHGSWTVINNQLTSSPKGGRPKSFTGGVDKFLDNLKATGIFPSPIARYVLNRKVPFLDLFERSDEVSVLDGLLSAGGISYKVLSVKRAGAVIRMYLDPKSNDLLMVSGDAQGSRGNMTSGSRIKISYQ